jgi:hypothetical protein
MMGKSLDVQVAEKIRWPNERHERLTRDDFQPGRLIVLPSASGKAQYLIDKASEKDGLVTLNLIGLIAPESSVTALYIATISENGSVVIGITEPNFMNRDYFHANSESGREVFLEHYRKLKQAGWNLR